MKKFIYSLIFRIRNFVLSLLGKRTQKSYCFEAANIQRIVIYNRSLTGDEVASAIKELNKYLKSL